MPWDLGLMTYTNIYDYEREVLVQFQIQQQIKDIKYNRYYLILFLLFKIICF